jgi:hemolysin III
VPTNPRPALHPTWNYSALEVFADGVVHAVGLALGVLGGALMVHASLSASSPAEITAVLVYVAGLIAMLAFSAAYNLWRVSPTKWVLRRLDHSAIYVMIAGTYTPLMAQVAGPPAALALVFVWAVAVVGILIKMLLPGRYDRASILLYLLLSWSVIAVYDRVAAVLPHSAIVLLIAGGLLYSGGVIFHLWRSLPFQNAIWHCFVLVAASCHWLAVFDGVIQT